MAEQEQQDGVAFSAELHRMPETTVFVNAGGGISIQQVDAFGDEAIVVFPVEMADAIIRLIQQAREAMHG